MRVFSSQVHATLRPGVALAILAGLLGCPVTPQTPVGGKATARPAPNKTAKPGPKATDTPASPSVVKRGASLLVKPEGIETRALSGVVSLDAAYTLAAKAGTFISDQGGGLISDKGGSLRIAGGLISDAGGNLSGGNPAGIISHHGAGLTAKAKLVSDQGGGLISNNGGGFISDQGGGLISNNGGGLVSNNGGGLISNNGGGLIGNNAAGYRETGFFGLLQAAAVAAGPGHEAVPAAGMLVGVMSLVDNAFLPLGIDASGNTVYAIYTDAKGGFTVHLPQNLPADNFIVLASVPGATDTRLAVDIVARGNATTVHVDEVTTLLTSYMRRALESRFEEVIDPDPCKPVVTGLSAATQSFGIVSSLYTDVFGADFKALGRPARGRVFTRFADAVIARLTIDDVQLEPALAPQSKATGTALSVLTDVLTVSGKRVGELLQANPAHFDTMLAVKLANLNRTTPYVLRKPSDVTEFVVEEFLLTSDRSVAKRLESFFVELGLPASLSDDLMLAGGSTFSSLIPLVVNIEDVAINKKAALAAIADEMAAADKTADPACPKALTPPTVTTLVSTLAGTGEASFADGPGASAKFNRPVRLLMDGATRLLVTEAGNGRIRSIDLVDPTHPVSTLIGAEKGFVDGPGAAARFSGPAGMAWKPGTSSAPTLWVADRGNDRIREIAGFGTPGAQVTTVAGTGVPGFADGTLALAQFKNPWDVAFGADGSAYVADCDNQRIRAISPTGMVTTLAGNGQAISVTGIGPTASVWQPRSLVVTASGELVVAERSSNLIRKLALTGAWSVLAGSSAVDSGPTNDGTFYTATFDKPTSMVQAPDGGLYVADTIAQRIRWLDPAGFVVTIAGGGPHGNDLGTFADGPGALARFAEPEGLALAPDGKLYVADTKNNRIRVIQVTH